MTEVRTLSLSFEDLNLLEQRDMDALYAVVQSLEPRVKAKDPEMPDEVAHVAAVHIVIIYLQWIVTQLAEHQPVDDESDVEDVIEDLKRRMTEKEQEGTKH